MKKEYRREDLLNPANNLFGICDEVTAGESHYIIDRDFRENPLMDAKGDVLELPKFVDFMSFVGLVSKLCMDQRLDRGQVGTTVELGAHFQNSGQILSEQPTYTLLQSSDDGYGGYIGDGVSIGLGTRVSAEVRDGAKLGKFNTIDRAIIGDDVVMGDRNSVMSNAKIWDSSRVGSDNVFGPIVEVQGGVVIGNNNLFGNLEYGGPYGGGCGIGAGSVIRSGNRIGGDADLGENVFLGFNNIVWPGTKVIGGSVYGNNNLLVNDNRFNGIVQLPHGEKFASFEARVKDTKTALAERYQVPTSEFETVQYESEDGQMHYAVVHIGEYPIDLGEPAKKYDPIRSFESLMKDDSHIIEIQGKNVDTRILNYDMYTELARHRVRSGGSPDNGRLTWLPGDAVPGMKINKLDNKFIAPTSGMCRFQHQDYCHWDIGFRPAVEIFIDEKDQVS